MGNIEDQNDPQISPGRALDALSIKGSIPLFEHRVNFGVTIWLKPFLGPSNVDYLLL